MKWKKIVNEISNETKSQHENEPKKGVKSFLGVLWENLQVEGICCCCCCCIWAGGGVGGGGGGAMGCKGTCMGIVCVDLEIKGTTGLENRFNTMRLPGVFFCNNNTLEAAKTPWEHPARTQFIYKQAVNKGGTYYWADMTTCVTWCEVLGWNPPTQSLKEAHTFGWCLTYFCAISI